MYCLEVQSAYFKWNASKFTDYFKFAQALKIHLEAGRHINVWFEALPLRKS